MMPTIASHLPLNISETASWDSNLVPKDHQWKWPTENQMVTWSMTSRDPERSNSWLQYTWSAISRKQLQNDAI